MAEAGLRRPKWRQPLCLLLLWAGLQGLLWLTTGEPVWAITLTTPTQGETLQSGKSVPVAVSVGKEVSLRAVRYYWYRIDEEPLASHRGTAAPFIAIPTTAGTGAEKPPASPAFRRKAR